MYTFADLRTNHRRLEYMMQRSDQWHALKYIRDDLTMSFACRMYSIFAMTCLINTNLFLRFKEGLLVKPWYCEDDTYPDFVKASFKWGVQHQYNQDYMNAHFDFWFDQVFRNPFIDFKYCEDFGIGAYAKIRGPLYSFTDHLFGFVEYISEEVFNHLKDTLKHWSLFKYCDDDLEWHYCIIYGTLSLVNHADLATANFQMLNGDFEAKETTLRVRYYYGLEDIHSGENIICIDNDTLVLQVERLELYLNEAIPAEEFLMNDNL